MVVKLVVGMVAILVAELALRQVDLVVVEF